MDECIQAVRELLTGRPIHFEGKLVRLAEAQILPAVSEPIPIVIGGRSNAAIHRAGQFGDGWFGIWVSAGRYRQVITQMEAAAQGVNRGSVRWTNALNVWCGVDKAPDQARSHVGQAMEAFYGLPYDKFEKWSPAGSPKLLAEFLVPYVAAGCSVFNLIINGPSADAEIDSVAEIRQRVLDATA
jgi:alkanesulfonate monooxygenase SsuD/methylene tetrahydromethanopterin reductase-like flavin-dependent oxidoreductase (luciferase family)